MRILIFALVLGLTAPAYADDFGQRFGNSAPQALEETTVPQSLLEIAPASGEEEKPVPEEFKSEDVDAPGQAATDPSTPVDNVVDPAVTGAEGTPAADAETATPPVVDGVPVTVPLETPPPAEEGAAAPAASGEEAPATEEPAQQTFE